MVTAQRREERLQDVPISVSAVTGQNIERAGITDTRQLTQVMPGLVFSRDLIEWFHEMEIPLLGTDTIANEVTIDPNNGIVLPLHSALMRNLGVIFNEILWLEDLAAECAKDGHYDFFYSAAPLKITGATGAPVNPIVIK